MFQDNCVDDVPAETRHAPPPSLVARTMSCDIRELCGELTHRLPLQYQTREKRPPRLSRNGYYADRVVWQRLGLELLEDASDKPRQLVVDRLFQNLAPEHPGIAIGTGRTDC